MQIGHVLRAKVAAEMEILKVTNPITVEEHVVGNELIAAEEGTGRPMFSPSANDQQGIRFLEAFV